MTPRTVNGQGPAENTSTARAIDVNVLLAVVQLEPKVIYTLLDTVKHCGLRQGVTPCLNPSRPSLQQKTVDI